MTQMDDNELDALIAERERTHGKWNETAGCASALKQVIRIYRHGSSLSAQQIEALENIAVKVARLLCGSDHADHWTDICGYSRIGARRGTAAPSELGAKREHL